MAARTKGAIGTTGGRARRSSLVAVLLGLLFVATALQPTGAAAHPLGNFTINHYSRLTFADGEVRVTYVLDFAEVPTFQQMKRLDRDGDGALSEAEAADYLDAELPALVRGLELTVGGRRVPLAPLDRAARFVPGQGGLPTLRIETRLGAELPVAWQGATGYADRNYPDRLGWREIVVRGGAGIAVRGTEDLSTDLSDELRAYPEDLLTAPLDRAAASFTLAQGDGADTAGRAAERVREGQAPNGGRATDRVAALIATERLSPRVILLSLLAAVGWGAAHALSPGHGKTVVAAYLVGTRGTAKHAAFLGFTVTATHTAGVFALGAVTLFLSRYLLPETLYPWLNVISGLLVVAIGLALVRQRLRGLRATTGTSAATGLHEHAEGYTGRHAHGGYEHSHLPPGADGAKVGWGGLLALGVSGGLVPCPSALVLLLGAISLGRIGFGMLLVLAFSAGLALVLTGIGLLLVYARRLFARLSFEPRLPRFLPVASAGAVSLAGLAIVFAALRQAGVV